MSSTKLTIGELRTHLTEQKARWSVDPNLRDEELVRTRPVGASSEGLKKATEAPAVNLQRILKDTPANPFLMERRKAHNLLPENVAIPELPSAFPLPHGQTAPVGAPAGAATPTAVDWRNRWGWPWITTIQDQDGCNACWAFAATALVETMVRIDHCVWSKCSESDVHDGMGAKCASLGSAQAALDWIKVHGITDEDNYPYRTNDAPYAPTADRSGRIVRIDDYTYLGDIQQQKTWLDTVGPIVTWFDVYDDFFAYHSGVYHRLNTPNNKEVGGHFMLIVGYDDNLQAWICKNSWGKSYGQLGYFVIGYGECSIDTYWKIGLHLTNPDPWTKRRLHNGNLVESGNGPYHRNFEMLDRASDGEIFVIGVTKPGGTTAEQFLAMAPELHPPSVRLPSTVTSREFTQRPGTGCVTSTTIKQHRSGSMVACSVLSTFRECQDSCRAIMERRAISKSSCARRQAN
jgi:Papain family cysteine protease